MIKRSVKSVNSVIENFLKQKNLLETKPAWGLDESPLGGIGVFALRDIETGEEIFKDFPIILGTRTTQKDTIFCVSCYQKSNTKPCSKNCGLPVCSTKCEENHKKLCNLIKNKRKLDVTYLDEELWKHSAPLYSLLLNEDDKKIISQLKYHKGPIHGFEINKLQKIGLNFDKHEEYFLKLVCCVMDANAFEVSVRNETDCLNLRGLYPLASLVNHSCVPNLMHIFNKDQLMVTRATVPIKKGEELFHSYVRLIWSTPSRLFHLYRTKHFFCQCLRCKDPKEFGSYISAILCKSCNGNVISENSLNLNSDWICENCTKKVYKKDVANLLSLLGSILNSIESDNIDIVFKLLNGKVSKIVGKNHEINVEMKYKLIWIIGYNQNYKWGDIDDNLLEFKKKICIEILELIKILRLGECNIKGLILYEFYLCLKEQNKRMDGFNKDNEEKLEEILRKSAKILRDDVLAPSEIRNCNSKSTESKNYY